MITELFWINYPFKKNKANLQVQPRLQNKRYEIRLALPHLLAITDKKRSVKWHKTWNDPIKTFGWLNGNIAGCQCGAKYLGTLTNWEIISKAVQQPKQNEAYK